MFSINGHSFRRSVLSRGLHSLLFLSTRTRPWAPVKERCNGIGNFIWTDGEHLERSFQREDVQGGFDTVVWVW